MMLGDVPTGREGRDVVHDPHRRLASCQSLRSGEDDVATRILVHAPGSPDGPLALAVLHQSGLATLECATIDDLTAALRAGAGAALVTDEAIASVDLRALMRWVEDQPAWSEFPFVLLTSRGDLSRDEAAPQRIMETFGNVSFLERPFHPVTLVSVARAALRARQRQYQMRDHLQERDDAADRLARSLDERRRAEAALRRLNETLEERVAAEISERELAQAALIQAQKMDAMGRMTGGIAHDFNNLLTAVLGNLELIGVRVPNPEIARLVANAIGSVQRGTKLVAQLMAFARRQTLHLEPVDVNELVDGMQDLLARSIGPKVRIEIETTAGAGHAIADGNQLELAILNLAINARDAMEDGGTLVIRTGPAEPSEDLPPGEYVGISVLDTGTGMPPDVMSRALEPFFTTKPSGKGTGLGLSQVYGIARQCGGTLRLSSVVGEGTTVEIVLPAAHPLSQAPTTPSATRIEQGRAERIVVVDDDADVCGFVVECLSAIGYRARGVRNGEECLRLLTGAHGDAELPDLLIVDYAMPGMNGGELAEAVRMIRPALPIIFATGFSDGEPLELPDGARMLRKPFRIVDLAVACRDMLGAGGEVVSATA